MSIKGIFPIDKWDFKSESVLSDLPLNDLELLRANKSEQVYKKGEIIFREGAYPAGIFYIISGKVKKYKLDKEGKEHIIYVANIGELLGYHADRRDAQIGEYQARQGRRASTLRSQGGSDGEGMWECAARTCRGVHRWTARNIGSRGAERQSNSGRRRTGANRRRRGAKQGRQHRA